MVTRRPIAVVLTLLAAGCGGGAPASSPPAAGTAPAPTAAPPRGALVGDSCDGPSGSSHVCEELRLPPEVASTRKGLCARQRGATSVGACPSAGLLGKCAMKLPDGGTVKQTLYYYASPGGLGAADLAKGCAANGLGVWSAP